MIDGLNPEKKAENPVVWGDVLVCGDAEEKELNAFT
jgi:hypothetical protein